MSYQTVLFCCALFVRKILTMMKFTCKTLWGRYSDKLFSSVAVITLCSVVMKLASMTGLWRILSNFSQIQICFKCCNGLWFWGGGLLFLVHDTIPYTCTCIYNYTFYNIYDGKDMWKFRLASYVMLKALNTLCLPKDKKLKISIDS